MSVEPQATSRRVDLTVENLGGIAEASLSFSRGVTILPGRNATNRTSCLSALGGVLGGSTAVVKSDAETGRVTLDFDDSKYSRTYSRRNGLVNVDGNAYTDQEGLVDHFVALFESNPARRAVERNNDLREVIMRPLDTEQIESRIADLTDRKRDLQSQLERARSRKQKLPDLEERRVSFENEISALDDELETLRAEVAERETDLESAEEAVEIVEQLSGRRQSLGQVRDRIETKHAERDALESELDRLQDEVDGIEDPDEGSVSELERDLRSIRERKRSIDDTIASLTTILEFNESVLTGEQDLAEISDDHSSVTQALAPESSQELNCWTCGQTVERGTVEDRLDALRSVIHEKRSERDDLEDRAQKLRDRTEKLKRMSDRADSLRRSISETEDKLANLDKEIDDLESQAEDLEGEIRALEAAAAESRPDRDDDVLRVYDEIGDLEYERGQMSQRLQDIEEEIEEIEDLPAVETLESELQEVEDDLSTERSRIDDLERAAVDAFNEHMDEILSLLDYDNLARVWIERKTPPNGNATASFDLHIVRETADETGYEDTVDNLSESEREVIGLVVALAGYLVHEVHKTVPFMLLDSVEAIDAGRLESIIEYLSDYVDYLLVALLPEDAARMTDGYDRVTISAGAA